MSALRKARKEVDADALALLLLDDDNENDVDNDDGDDDDDDGADANPFGSLEHAVPKPPRKPRKPVKPKAKKEPKPPKPKKNVTAEPPVAAVAASHDDDDDDAAAAAAAAVCADDATVVDAAASATAAESDDVVPVLESSTRSVDFASLRVSERLLNGENELRRLFGNATVDEANAERARHVHPLDQQRVQQMQRRGQAPHARPSLAALRARAYVLVTVREAWPRVDLAMSMKLLRRDRDTGVKHFALTHRSAYKKLQRQYERECVSSGDPNAVFAVLKTEPFHMASLMQLANLSVRASDMPSASDYCERLLYAFESVKHREFVFNGTARLPFAVEAYRVVHHCMFRYVQLLGRRGALRAAFEFCKLLLSLDPSDPLAILAVIDHYALRSKQFAALDRIFNDAALAEHRLDCLVNMQFSTALAAFRRRGSDDAPDADALLQRALLRFPHAIVELLSRNGKPADAEQVLQQPLFALDTTHLPSLQHLVKLFAERNHDLWRGAEVLKWILHNAAVVAALAESEAVKHEEALVDAEYDGGSNSFAHLRLDDFTDHIEQLPEDVAAQLRHGAPMFQNFRAEAAPRVRIDPRMGLVRLFLQTLLMCWRPLPNARAHDDDDDGELASDDETDADD